MKIYRYEEMSSDEVRRLCVRNPVQEEEILETCREIFRQVEERGDEAVSDFTERYDGVRLEDFRVDGREFQEAVEQLDPGLLEALELAARNIRRFHASQKLQEDPVTTQEGVTCWRAARAISSVGLYVPGGTAVLPSSVLMLGVPAKLAGCSRVVLCVPPDQKGSVAPAVLAAAQIAGVRQVFKIGGAQAVAAMALGTATVPRVDKILGPGNRWVQTAKLLSTFHGSAIDMVAGPSEVLVIADTSASARVVAADLISQAEHGVDSQSILVSTSQEWMEECGRQVEKQLEDLPRSRFARGAMDQSFGVLVASVEKAFEFSNRYAPEHLILNFEKAREWVKRVHSAGSVFVGPWTPEVAGDYASGTNHTLPTAGAARAFSGVSLDSFVKKVTFQELTPKGLRDLAPILETLATEESLEGHARAVRFRLEEEDVS